MKRAKILKIMTISLIFTFAAGTTKIYARVDIDDKHYQGYSNMSNGIYDPQDYKNKYDQKYKNKFPKPEEQITIDKAQSLVYNYINLLGMPGLRSGKIIDRGNEFEAEILTSDESLFDKIIIDKQSGKIKSQH
jgi:hypothetical protein